MDDVPAISHGIPGMKKIRRQMMLGPLGALIDPPLIQVKGSIAGG